MNLIKLEFKTDVEDTLKKALNDLKNCDAVIVLGLGEGGRPLIRTSSISGYQKAWLLAAATAQLHSMFGFKKND